MGPRDTTSGERAANRELINSLLENRHARKDMLNGLFRNHFTTPATIRCELADHVVHLDPLDSTITPAILEKGHWNRDELERAVDVLRSQGVLHDGGVFVDVGANIGTQTLYALLSGAFLRAYAFEPDPGNATLLRGNLAENDMTDRVQVMELGVSDSRGTRQLHLHPRNRGGHTLETQPLHDGQEASIDVDTVSLDAFFDGTAVHLEEVGLVWIDVEGHEPAVVRGANHVLAHGVPIVFELLERDLEQSAFADMFLKLRRAYSNVCCLQDPDMSISPIERLTPELPAGDYLVFSSHD